MVQKIPLRQIGFALAQFLILLMIGCGDPQREIIFQESDKTPNVRITLQSSDENTIIDYKDTDSQGKVSFIGEFKEGNQIKFKIKAKSKTAVIDWITIDDNESFQRDEITINKGKIYKIGYHLEDILKEVNFSNSRKLSGIKIYGENNYGAKSLLGQTDRNGRLSLRLGEEEWSSIRFTAEYIDGTVVSSKLAQRYNFDYFPSSNIQLSVYPKQDCFLKMKIMEKVTKNPISNASIKNEETGFTWKSDSYGQVFIRLSENILREKGFQIGDQISFKISSEEFGNQSKTFFIDARRYNEVQAEKNVRLKKVYKLKVVIQNQNNQFVPDANVLVGKTNVGKADESGLTIYEYAIDDIGKSVKIKASKTGYFSAEKEFVLSEYSGHSVKLKMEKIESITISVQNESTANTLQGKKIQLNGKQFTSDHLGEINVYPDKEFFDISYQHLKGDIKYYPKSGQFQSTPSSRNFTISLKEREMVKIVIRDEDTGDYISKKEIYINNKKYTTDDYGQISVYTEKESSHLTFQYDGKDKMYYPLSQSFQSSPSERMFYVELKPIVNLIVNCFAPLVRGGMDPLEGVSVDINDGLVQGKSDEDGKFMYQVPKDGMEDILVKVSMLGYESNEKNVDITSTTHQLAIYLRQIRGKIIVQDVYGEAIPEIQIKIKGQVRSITNSTGRAGFQLEALNKPIEIEAFDPTGRYKTKKEILSFKSINELRKMTLNINPISLDVHVNWSSGPASGFVYVSPTPDPKKIDKGYKLRAGKAVINVYRPNTYRISYETTGYVVVSASQNIKISMKGDSTLYFPEISDVAEFFVKVDNGSEIDVEVFDAIEYKSGTNKGHLGSIKGNGNEKFDLSAKGLNYGDLLILVYRRAGWSADSEEKVILEKPNQTFVFSVGSSLAKCKELEKNGDYIGACNECKKILPSDSDYCDSRETMIKIYRYQLNNSESALKAVLEYIENTTCGEHYAYNLNLFSFASKSEINNQPERLRKINELPRLYNDTRTLIIRQVGPDKRGNKLRELDHFASTHGINLIRYLKNESKKPINRQNKPDLENDMDEIYERISSQWTRNLPSSKKKNFIAEAQRALK